MTDLIVLATALPASGSEALAIEVQFLRRAFDRVVLVGPAPPTPGSGVERIPARRRRSVRVVASPTGWSWLRTARRSGLGGIARVKNAIGLRDAIPGGDAVLLAFGADAAIALAMRRRDARPSAVRLSRADVADLDPLRLRALATIDRIFVVSPDDRARLAAAHPGIAARINVFPAAVMDPHTSCRASDDGVLRVLTCGDIAGSTRLRLLASALRKTAHPVEWLHAGGGGGLSALVASAASLPAPVRTRFLGVMTDAGIDALFRDEAIDLFFDVDEDERGRMSVLRALAYGVPVLALGGNGDEILEGWTLPADIPTAELALRIQAFAAAPADERIARRQAARRRWETTGDAASRLAGFADSLRALRPVAA